MEDVLEEMHAAISKDLVAWSRRGDDERLTGVVEAIADIMVEVGAGRMAEARSLMGKLLAWRNTFYDAELAEARAIKVAKTEDWTKMRDAVQYGLKLDGNQLGAMNAVLGRVLDDASVAMWLDVYGAVSFEELLRREATPEELEVLRRSPTLQLLLSVEKEGQC